MNPLSAKLPVLLQRSALILAAAGALSGVSCNTIFPPPAPAPMGPGFAPPGPNRYGYQGTESPNYTEPRALPANPSAGQREIKRDPNNTTVDVTPPPPRTKPTDVPPAETPPSSTTDTPPSVTPPTTTPPAVTPVPREDLPYGIPVVNKKGMVYSPYAEDKGQVDVEGLKRGTRVKCPYTGKHFRVP